METRRLAAGIPALLSRARGLSIPALEDREWYQVLQRKLLPQLAGEPFLIVAVVGGTNIGKSAIFNHIAQSRASATSPLASGTRQPVCLVPEGFLEKHDLAALFEGFVPHPWKNPDEALRDTPEHRLYWRTAGELHRNLLLLDTPDIDSDVPINWLRADLIRHSADVLIAVLTQQKYNDAAVKQFFRKAAAEGKAALVVFNQCELPDDEAYWPLWMRTFAEETGLQPEQVYVIPKDRQAVERNELPCYRRSWSWRSREGEESVGAAAQERPAVATFDMTPHPLGEELSRLHFAAIKLRTLRGGLRLVLEPRGGLPCWLEEIRRESHASREALDLLCARQLLQLDNWPAAPATLVVNEVRHWWQERRTGWTRSVHQVYSRIGTGVLWPLRWMRRQIQGPAPDVIAEYLQRERGVLVQALDQLYDELTRLCRLGNALLRPRLERLLSGATRAALVARLADEHQKVDLSSELATAVASQMEQFERDSPQMFSLLQQLDSLAAMARPMTSVVLFFAAGPGGHMLADVAAHSLAGHVVGEVANGTGAVVLGETMMTGAAGGLRYLEARFGQLQSNFTARRVAWFSEFLRQHLLGELQTDLELCATTPQSPEFREVEKSLLCLSQLLSQESESAADK